jgi:hypothetical protein
VTPFAELDAVLDDLVHSAASILGRNLVGLYVTGSFALGAGDLQSDCDFVAVVREPVTAEQERALRALHDELPTRPGHWTKHLEGSYAPQVDLETLAALGRDWLYIDHGRREMQWDAHCNRLEHRWTLRERGMTLAGPDPRSFVAEVPGDLLRSTMRSYIQTFVPDLLAWTSFDLAWTQRYAVTTLCRMLYTFETGEVTSKPAALAWARDALDPEWRELIQQALADRPLPWNDPPRPASVDATLAFADYARARSSSSRPPG